MKGMIILNLDLHTPLTDHKFLLSQMIKLAHNTLVNSLILESPAGQIKWCYFEYLHEIQTNLSFKFANKINSVHLNWQRNKMKVKYVVQLLSSSTANAIEYLKNNYHK